MIAAERMNHHQFASPRIRSASPTSTFQMMYASASPVTISVYLEDVDAVVERALAAGATSLRPVEDQFYGDRSGSFEDPFGHRWSVATHVEDVAPDEMARRAEAATPES